jgi:hypothetical protein
MSKRARRLAAGLFPLQVELLENRLLLSAAATTTTLAASSDPILLGQIIALTATVSATGSSPNAGTVTFMDGTTVIGTANVDSTTHQAIGFTNSLTLGTHPLTAVYNGTTNFSTSTSSVTTETVDPTTDLTPNSDVTTTTTLTSSQSPIGGGLVVALIAHVSATSGSPTGIVSFFDGSSLIGTVSVTAATGIAVAFTNTLTAGTHAITATYDGATGFATSTSAVFSEVINGNTITTTSVTASSSSVTQGQVLALTATVAGGATTGTVTFIDGTTPIGTVAIDPTSHKAVGLWNGLSVGAHTITATYNGTPGFATSTSPVVNVAINTGVSTTTTLSASSPTTVIGQLIAITATVTGAGGIPTGTVSFMDGSTSIGTASIDPTTGKAVAFTSFVSSGTHNITATYSGDIGYLTSKASTLAETVNLVGADTATTVTVFPSPGVAGQVIGFSATVTSSSGTPTGTVTFTDGATLLGTVAIDPTTHQATGFTNALAAGTHSITATYNGSATFAGSVSSAATEVVNPSGTLTTNTLTTSSHALVFGQVVAITATITATSGSAAGSVTFMDGTMAIGTVAVNTTTHTATAFSAGLTPGMHNLTAVFTGTNGFANSTSAIVHVTVNSDATATTLTASGNNVTAGSVVGFVATITPEAPGGGIPTGTVTFEDGSSLIGTVNVDPTSGNAVGFTNALTPGAHSITAIYTPGAGYSASTSTVLSETIVGIATTTTVTASTASTTMGQTVTFTAAVTGAGAMPTGTVTFSSGSTTIGTGTLDGTGTATLSEYNLFTGTYPITATYAGDNIHTTSVSTGSTSLTITNPTFTTLATESDGPLQMAIATAGAPGAPAAQNGQLLEIDYTGYLSNGTKFDSSLNPGRTPFFFGLGGASSEVILGWEQGIIGTKVGETRVLVIPPSLAYMAAGSPPSIPGNATLTFIVRLIAVDVPRLTVNFGAPGATSTVPVTLNQTPSTAAGTNFGTESIGLSTAPSTFTFGDADSSAALITSTGNPIVQITGADAADFVITQPPFLFSVNPSTEQVTPGTFTIAFLPTATGVRTATIHILTSDSDQANFSFTVTGVGV